VRGGDIMPMLGLVSCA